MKKRIFSIMLAVCMLLSIVPMAVFAVEEADIFASGDGTSEATAYTIATLEQLEAFRNSVNDGNDYSGQFIKLTADIDMSTKYGEGKGEGGSNLSWTPIGVHEKKYDFDTEMVVDTANARPFKGTFDGDGHVIDVYMNITVGIQGLFVYVGDCGTVKNLGIDGEISSTGSVAGVAAYNYGIIEDCYNAATISGTGDCVSGVVYRNQGTVEGCYNIGTLIADTDIGSSGSYIGGVVSLNFDGMVRNCYNSGIFNISDQMHHAGGVVGENNGGTIEGCYNSSTISCAAHSGGVVSANDGGLIKDCYNTGTVNVTTGNKATGGIISINHPNGTVENCYNIGTVSATNVNTDIGGVVGGNQGTVTNCYYLDNSCSIDIGYVYGSGTGTATSLTREEFKAQSKFSGFDFTDAWAMSAFLGRPILKAIPEIKITIKGDGKTAETPFEIPDLPTLEAFRDAVNGGNDFSGQFVKLTADIDMSTKYGEGKGEGGTYLSWTPIGVYATKKISEDLAVSRHFEGTFDGDGHVIDVYINKPAANYQGLFVYIGENGTVKNLGIGGEITGGKEIGGVSSLNYGTVEGCYNAATVSGDFFIGGVVGRNNGNAMVKNCYNTATVSGNHVVAGIVAYNPSRGTVDFCYNFASITGTTDDRIGGVAGGNQGTVTNCYYLNTSCSTGIGETKNFTATAKSAAEFASGEVAYLLQGTQTEQIWGQTLTGESKDSEPVLTSDSSKRVCKVSFLNVDGSAYKTLYANYNGTVTLPTEPAVDSGFKFDSWLVDGTETEFTATTTVTQDITLKAQQIRNVFNVTYKDGKDGTIFADQSDSINSGESTPTFKGDLTNVTSYVFDGWDKTIASTVTEDVVYTAKWRNKAANKLILNGNGGTVGTSSTAESTTDEKSLAIGENTFVREGYHFTGWNTLANGKGTAYNSGDLVNFTAIHNAETVTLYAQWEVNSDYEISFNYGADLGTSRSGNVKWTDKVLDGITEPKRNGYRFDGWFCNDKKVTENTTYAELAVNDTVKSIELIAKWTDTENPSISGIENGKTYCSAQTITVTDNGIIKSVTVNGNGVDLDENGKFTLNPSAGEQEIIVTDTDGNTATMKVTVNDGHEGGTATCKDKAVCDYCGEKYGDVDSSNHVGGTEVRNAKDAKCTEDGYTGDTYCKGCDAKLQDGKPITKLGHTDANKDHICDVESCKATISACSGGEATCCEKAVCDYCGKHYGDLNSENHTGEKVWTADDENHEQKWDCCGETVVKKEEHDYKWGICEECGHEHTNRISFIFQSIFVNVTSFTVKLFTGLVNFLKELNVFNFPCLR